MYGMIHRAARAYAIETLGQDFWDGFAVRHALSETDFVTAQCYPDERTGKIIGGLAEAAGIPTSEMLTRFGVFWIDFARRGPYGQMIAIGGKTLPAFISNLNRMHAGLAISMPGSQMPKFFLVSSDATGLRVCYESVREGLEPFVLGLLGGLCEMFDLAADVELTGDAAQGVTFEVRYRDRIAA